MRKKLRGWNANIQGELKRNKQHLIEQLEHYENLHDSNTLTEHDLTTWKDCQTSLYKIYQEEESHWQQRSRLKWFLEGDLNTKFFHLVASIRKQRNTILSLEINGVTIYDPKILQEHITTYFRDLLVISRIFSLHLT